MGGASLRARRGAAAEFGCSLRNVSCQAQMNILLSPPPLLLLLAALVAPATFVTTYRPDWNRLRGLARGRVEVSVPFLNLGLTVPQPCCPSSLVIQPTLASGIPEFLGPPLSLLHGPGSFLFICQQQDAQHLLWKQETSSLRPGTLNPCSPPGLAQPWVSGHQSPLSPAIGFLKLPLRTQLISSLWIPPPPLFLLPTPT